MRSMVHTSLTATRLAGAIITVGLLAGCVGVDLGGGGGGSSGAGTATGDFDGDVNLARAALRWRRGDPGAVDKSGVIC